MNRFSIILAGNVIGTVSSLISHFRLHFRNGTVISFLLLVMNGFSMNIKSILVRIKNWIVNILKGYWHLNWEAKIGVLFLIPPILGVLAFIFNFFFDASIGFDDFPESWNCIYGYNIYGEGGYGYAVTPAIPLYLGLMAIAGAYLIKGNLRKEE